MEDRAPAGEPGPTRAEREAREWDEDHGAIGIFPSWKALYLTVVGYALLLILIFFVLSSVLDFSG